MGDFDDIIPEYLTESRELLENVEAGLLRLEEGGAQDETVHTVFRAIHSIKGGAGFVGLVKIERLAHKMEDLLNLIRNHDLEPSQPITDALIQSLDVLNSLFERVDEHDAIDIDGPIRALSAALEAGVGHGVREQMQTMEAPHADAGLPAFEVSEYNLKNKLKQGNLFHISLDMQKIEQRGLTPIQLVNEMLSMGEILDSLLELPAVGDADTYEVASIRFNVLYSTVLEADLLSAALRLDDGEYRLVTAADFGISEGGEASPAPVASPRPEPQPVAPPPPTPPAQPARPAPKPQAPQPAPAAPRAARPAQEAPPQPAPMEASPVEDHQDDTHTQLPVVHRMAEAPPLSRGGEYLTFSLGTEAYGVDILQVQEIIGLPQLTRLPRCPEHVLGVMNLRGMVVPVLDMRIKLHLPCTEGCEGVVVVLRVGEHKIMGAVVDNVRDVVQLKEEQVQDPPDFAGGIRRDYLRGLCHQEDEMVILLELDKLLAQEALGNAA